MVIDDKAIQAYLQHHVAPTDWQIQPPQRGFSSAKRYIARSSHATVFVKLGSDHRVLQLLSDAELTPRLLAGGAFGDTRITVQEFVEGYHPTREWYAGNMAAWAQIMHTVHQLPGLRHYLPASRDETYQSLLARYVEQVRAIYTPNNLQTHEREVVEALLVHYESRIPFVQGAGLVPIHGDPNADNLLITPRQVYLVDWDTMHLSEPMRDVALVLWWMYPASLWPELLARFRIDLADPAQQERFYLHISVWALEVSLFFANAQQRQWKERFLRDAQRAYARQEPVELLVS